MFSRFALLSDLGHFFFGLCSNLFVLLVESRFVKGFASFVKVVQVDWVSVHVTVRVLWRDFLYTLWLRPLAAHELNDAFSFLFFDKIYSLLFNLISSLVLNESPKFYFSWRKFRRF